ncbi:MAG: hypothetical protein Q7S33_05015 [Nanoarchaeota archaeon]|nr:hypothetical protein [Nanoarchaeota archaeon]
MANPKYDVQKEYINITNYSPFCHINEVSQEYREKPFELPFIFRFFEERPVHPDTFHDLKLNENEIIRKKLVFPTSSFRTMYEPEENICYKVPLLRKITRCVRDLQPIQMKRSERASVLLENNKFEGFQFVPEECHYADDPIFNFIIRKMPETEVFPWFYVISSQKFNSDFEINCMSQIIKSWMFLASKGIYLESPHTQNFLVDNNSTAYYRDLSDIRVFKAKSHEDEILLPVYYGRVQTTIGEDLAVIFDRCICNQNLDHLFRYGTKLGEREKKNLKELIESEIKKYGLPFPEYSMDFSKDIPSPKTPEKRELVYWRKFN